MNDFNAFLENAITFVATYFVHSTILLASCWLVLTVSRAKSHYLAERMWKLAAVLGVITAATQMFFVTSNTPQEYRSLEANPQVFFEPVTLYQHDGTAFEGQQDVGLGETVDWHDPPLSSDAAPVQRFDQVVLSSPFDAVSHAQPEPVEFDATQKSDGVSHAIPIEEATFADVSAADEVPQVLENNPVGAPRSIVAEWLPSVSRVCSIAMLCGGIVGALLLFIQATRWRLRIGRVRVVHAGAAIDSLQRFCKRHKIRRRVRLLASNHHAEPFAYGLIRWTIVLPDGVEQRLERNELKALIAHEMAHLVRGDVWWLWIGRLLCTCCAFQPLNFLARRRWQQAAEFLCDDWAVERGVRSLALARCLTRVAEWRFGVESPEVGLAAGGSKATLVGRVQRLVGEQSMPDAWKTPWRRRALTMGAAVAVVVLVGFMPRVALPGVALPLTRVSEFVAEVTSVSIAPAVEQPTTSDWHALDEELLQLDADLGKVNELRIASLRGVGNETKELSPHFENLNRRAASLRVRREQIASLIEKESER